MLFHVFSNKWVANKKHHLEKIYVVSKMTWCLRMVEIFQFIVGGKNKKHHLPSPETSKSQLNTDAWKTIPFLLGVGLFSGALAVSFRECISFSPHLKASSNVLSDWSIFLDMCRNKSKKSRGSKILKNPLNKLIKKRCSMWMFRKIVVHTPKSSILIGFSIIFTIHFGVPLFLETPMLNQVWLLPP